MSRLQPGTDLGDSGLEVLENGGLLTARMPAVLVEPVFLSNPEEAARLADPAGERREAIAAAVTDGVDTWLRSQRTGSARCGRYPWSQARAGYDRGGSPAGGAPWSGGAGAGGGAPGGGEAPRGAAGLRHGGLPPGAAGRDRPRYRRRQSAHETGWWQSPAWTDHLNPAGIGITGPDAASPSWESGVEAARAHLVHLFLYAAGPIPPGHPLEPYIPLDPRYEAALAAGRAGRATSLADLTGLWAPTRTMGNVLPGSETASSPER